MEDDTVWLTQVQIAELFGTKRQAISKHLGNIFRSNELDENSVCSKMELTASDGKLYSTLVYNLDAILSVGYRVNSKNASEFRKWANKILKDYLLRKHEAIYRISILEQEMAQTKNILNEHTEKIDFFIRHSLPPTEGIFYSGQVFDAYVFVSDLITRATSRIILIDNYIDTSVLTWLDKRHENVSAHIYTHHISAQMQLDIQRHNAQYPPIPIDILPNIHDRFLIIDDSLYHIGASIKDLGKKLFVFTKMEMKADDMMRFIGI